jgi:hypothetical protein
VIAAGHDDRFTGLLQAVVGDLELGRRVLELEPAVELELRQRVHPLHLEPREIARGGERVDLGLGRRTRPRGLDRGALDVGVQRGEHMAAPDPRTALDGHRLQHTRRACGDLGGVDRFDHTAERGRRRRRRWRRGGRGRRRGAGRDVDALGGLRLIARLCVQGRGSEDRDHEDQHPEDRGTERRCAHHTPDRRATGLGMNTHWTGHAGEV